MSSNDSKKIYINIIDGTECRIPVQALPEGDGKFRILPNPDFEFDDTTELWEFEPGDLVTIQKYQFTSGEYGNLAVSAVNNQTLSYKKFLFRILKSPSSLLRNAKYDDYAKRIKEELSLGIFHYPAIIDWLAKQTGTIQFKIEQTRLCINDDCVRINPYLLDSLYQTKNVENLQGIFKKLFQAWSIVLQKNPSVAFLPYSFDDEYIEAFKATKATDTIVLQCVTIDFIGMDFNFNLPEIIEFMLSNTEITKEYSDTFAEYQTSKFLAGLDTFVRASE